MSYSGRNSEVDRGLIFRDSRTVRKHLSDAPGRLADAMESR